MEIQAGYLGQSKSVQKSSSFILYSAPKRDHTFAYPLSTFEENFEKGEIGNYQEFNLIVKSYDGYRDLIGPYKGATIRKYIKRLLTAQEEGRPGATDAETYAKNIKATSNMRSLVELMESDKQEEVIQFQ